MKKFALLLISLSLFLSACGGSEKVAYLEFSISDELSNVKLRLEPDYENRTFNAIYTRDFTATEEDESAEGTLGGENFENFEKSVKLVSKYDPTKVEQVAGVPNVVVQIAKADGTVKSVEAIDQSPVVNETVEELRTYYLEWVTLLTEDEQI